MKTVIIALMVMLPLSSLHAAPLDTKQTKQLFDLCMRTRALDVKETERRQPFCLCLVKNHKYLTQNQQFPDLVKLYEQKLSESEMLRLDPLIGMDYDIDNSCLENTEWIAPKIKSMSKKSK